MSNMARGPKITITCDCGEPHRLTYGERYVCACGRHWSTDQIPPADYAAIRQLDRRYRLVGWIVALVFAAFVLFVMLANPTQLLIVVPAGLLGWFAFCRPIVRRKHFGTGLGVPRRRAHDCVLPGRQRQHRRPRPGWRVGRYSPCPQRVAAC